MTRLNSKSKKDRIGWLFVSPWLIGFVGFTVIPLLVSLYISFTEWNMFSEPNWVGFDNYLKLFDETTKYGKAFSAAFSNTILYTVVVIIINVVTGIAVAWSISKPSKLNSALRIIVYMPVLTISTATAIMMDNILGVKNESLINRILISMGQPTQNWLATPGQAVWVMIILGFWGIGGAMLTYLTGIKNIDNNIYDAAKIDGAGRMTLLFKICIPLISGVIVYQVIMSLVFGLQVFDLAVGLNSILSTPSGSMGVDNSLATLVFYLYNKGFKDFEMGVASAIGWIIFLITSVISAGLLVFVNKTGYYSLDD